MVIFFVFSIDIVNGNVIIFLARKEEGKSSRELRESLRETLIDTGVVPDRSGSLDLQNDDLSAIRIGSTVVWGLFRKNDNLICPLGFVIHMDLLPTWIILKGEALLNYPAMKGNRN